MTPKKTQSGKVVERRVGSSLDRLVATLVSQWGYENVKASLDRTSELGVKSPTRTARTLRSKDSRVRTRQRATAHLAKMDIPAEKKAALLELTAEFDRKQFLPSVPAIKHFLELSGGDVPPMRRREDASAAVVRALSKLSNAQIAALIANGQHHGPSKLGPLSDAIRDTGVSLRGVAEPASKEPFEHHDRDIAADETTRKDRR
jgi:hypothetical protein